VQGAENRKKWRREWKAQDECPLTLPEFIQAGLGEPNFLLWRLSRSCDAGCSAQVAIDNLKHPCTRYLLLENFDNGLQRLRDTLGKPYHSAIDALARSREVVNRATYSERVLAQLRSETIMADLRAQLKQDLEIYRAAQDFYEAQWMQPLQSCNPM